MTLIVVVILAAIAFSLLGLFFRLLKGPMKLVWKIFIHALFGFVFLFVFNFFGAWVGLNLEMNWLNAAVAGVFGIPGVVLLLIIQYLL